MAITSEIIGKLGGGAGVEVIPVEVSNSEISGTEEVFHTVEVPEGETWLVALHGNLKTIHDQSTSSPQLVIGTTEDPPRARNGIRGLAHVGTGTIDVKLRSNSRNGTNTFTGHVYVAKL